MFSSIGWPEIFVLLVLGIIFVGPERLPRIVEDVRAAIYAARKAIANAKQELSGEFDGLGEELEEFRKPLSQVAQMRKMGPRGVITKALFDGDDEFMDSFDPNKIMKDDTAGQARRRGGRTDVNRVERNDSPQAGVVPQPEEQQPPRPQKATFDYSQIYAAKPKADKPDGAAEST